MTRLSKSQHNHILDCKRLPTAIRRAKKHLTLALKEGGVYENFGQDEVRLIEDEFISLSSYTNEMNNKRRTLDMFNHWCMSFDQRR